MAPVDPEAHTPLPISGGPLVRRLEEQVNSLQAQVDELQRAYPVVAGMTPSQRKGVIAGTGGAIVACVAILPQAKRLWT